MSFQMFNIKKPPTRSSRPNAAVSKNSSTESAEGFSFTPPKAGSSETSPTYSPLTSTAVRLKGTSSSSEQAATTALSSDLTGRPSNVSQQEYQKLVSSEGKLMAELKDLRNKLSAVEAENDVLKVHSHIVVLFCPPLTSCPAVWDVSDIPF